MEPGDRESPGFVVSETLSANETPEEPSVTDKTPDAYVPPRIWKLTAPNGGAFANINRPTAGARHEKELPVGRHPLQIYSLATPNGVKVTILLEELLAIGHTGAEYDAWL